MKNKLSPNQLVIYSVINRISVDRNQIGSTLLKFEIIWKGYIWMNFIAAFALSSCITLLMWARMSRGKVV